MAPHGADRETPRGRGLPGDIQLCLRFRRARVDETRIRGRGGGDAAIERTRFERDALRRAVARAETQRVEAEHALRTRRSDHAQLRGGRPGQLEFHAAATQALGAIFAVIKAGVFPLITGEAGKQPAVEQREFRPEFLEFGGGKIAVAVHGAALAGLQRGAALVAGVKAGARPRMPHHAQGARAVLLVSAALGGEALIERGAAGFTRQVGAVVEGLGAQRQDSAERVAPLGAGETEERALPQVGFGAAAEGRGPEIASVGIEVAAGGHAAVGRDLRSRNVAAVEGLGGEIHHRPAVTVAQRGAVGECRCRGRQRALLDQQLVFDDQLLGGDAVTVAGVLVGREFFHERFPSNGAVCGTR